MLDVSVTTSVSGAVEIGSSAEGKRAQSATRPTTTTIDAPTMMAERRSPMSFHPKGSRKNNLAESAALNPTGDLTNAQFPMLNSHPKWMSDCEMFHRCKTRSHCRTNSKNDSLNSQQGSLVLQAGSYTCRR